MVNLLFANDQDALTKPGVIRTLYDPACGTGGMLSVAEDHLRALNPDAKLRVFGQELNAETYAVCRSDMMLKGQDATNIHFGNSFTDDGTENETFDYMLANPPFGVEWKKYADDIKKEHETMGDDGRFGAGLPRINDGSFLFLQHMLSKMKGPKDGGSRLAIVFNASPLFTGQAGSGESNIRRWIIENDWLEAIVALPDQLFYNTGISTYFWILTGRQTEGTRPRSHRRDRPPLRRLPGGRESQGLPQRRLRVQTHHGGATPAAAMGSYGGDHHSTRNFEGLREGW
jgi:type I restriction enzyme M protein